MPTPFDNPRFDGDTYDEERDQQPLKKQLQAVAVIMADHQWRTLEELAESVTLRIGRRASEASVSARLRDLRKPRFGGKTVERRAKPGAKRLFQYRIPEDS
jgi:hypothetical protein